MDQLQINTTNLEVLGQGLVFIKGAINKEMQIFLSNYAMEAGTKRFIYLFIYIIVYCFIYF